MAKEKLDFTIFVLYSLSERWEKTPAEIYQILSSTDILNSYIIGCYDTLHCLGKEYLVQDITEFAREKGVAI